MGSKIIYEWDEVKNQSNKDKHGIAFEMVSIFEWEFAIILDVSRDGDNENRYKAIAPVDSRFHTIIFTKREGATRIISFRPSNNSEIRRWKNA